MQPDFIGDIRFDENEIEQMKEDYKKFYRSIKTLGVNFTK